MNQAASASTMSATPHSPPSKDLEFMVATILWQSRKNEDTLRKLQYSRAASALYFSWSILMRLQKQLSAPPVTEVQFQSDADHEILQVVCNLWQKLQV